MKIRIKDPRRPEGGTRALASVASCGLRPGNGVPILHDRDRRLFESSELVGADGGGLKSFLSDPNPTCE